MGREELNQRLLNLWEEDIQVRTVGGVFQPVSAFSAGLPDQIDSDNQEALKNAVDKMTKMLSRPKSTVIRRPILAAEASGVNIEGLRKMANLISRVLGGEPKESIIRTLRQDKKT